MKNNIIHESKKIKSQRNHTKHLTTFCLFSKSHGLKIMIQRVVASFCCFLLHLLSWQHCNFGAATKTPLEKIVFKLGPGQVSSLKHPRICPGSTVHPVGIKMIQPSQIGAWDKKGRGAIWGKIQRKQLSKSPWSWNTLSKSWQAVPALPRTLFAFAFPLGPDFQLICWARLPSLSKCQWAQKRVIQIINNSQNVNSWDLSVDQKIADGKKNQNQRPQHLSPLMNVSL